MSPSKDAVQLPSTSTFSFQAPFPASTLAVPAIKQRRVSHVLPSSPRLVQAWSFRDDTGLDAHVPETETPAKKGKMRKLANGAESEPSMEKKQRKKWSDEETQMLVTGCNRHGVGNWKTILSDPTLHFDSRSPVDLKDRFRTYFPDAYKRHYPNARTHLSSKVRSTLPDGSSLFEKTRSKKRRPFTEEEDRALKAGYEKHGTVWATIVKDPVFREQGRRSTDLRDRFRNAFPELYQAAGYKPRNSSKKRQMTDEKALPVRAATDDQLSMSTTGPVRSRRRAHTSQGLFRGGTKSVPQSTACSEDDDSSAGEEDGDSVFKAPHTPIFVDNVSTSSSRSKKFLHESFSVTDDDDMDMVTFDQTSSDLQHPQYPNNDLDTHSQTWSGANTPTHSHHTWSTAAGSPTSSHLSDYRMSGSSSHAHSPALPRGTIGNSAWGTHDWFSANPRLDPGHGAAAYPADTPLSPASPFSFTNLSHGVLDRYDLVPSLMPHDFSSEVGVGDSHSTFSDEMFPPSGFRGFTHHSSYAGDLIFGARTQHAHSSASASIANQNPNLHQNGNSNVSANPNANLNSNAGATGYVPPGFAGAGGSASFSAFGTPGLGLSGISQSAGIHPLQLALPGIDELGLTNITLDDSAHEDAGLPPDHKMDDAPPPRVHGVGVGKEEGEGEEGQGDGDVQEKFSLDDLVDLSAHGADEDEDGDGDIEIEAHATPPGTPHIRGVRRSSESTFGAAMQHDAPNARSVSVPPSEARAGAQVLAPLSPRAPLLPRQGVYFAAPDQSASTSAEQGADKSVLSSPMPPPPPPLPLPTGTSPGPGAGAAYILGSALAPETYTWRPMSPGEMSTLTLPFLDLHYYAGGGDVGVGVEEAQQALELDLARAGAGAGAGVRAAAAAAHVGLRPGQLGVGVGVGVGGKGVGVPGAGSGSVLGRSQSHHRGQSAVCPQDLVLRSDNKRKRASWDGAHG